MKKLVLFVVLCMMMGFLLTGQCTAEDAAAFYKGKVITVLVPSKPGVGFDLVSRAIAPYLEKYTGATLLMESGREILSQNKLYRAKPDGLTIILSGHGAKEITAQLFKEEGANFNWKEFVFLGRVVNSGSVFAIDKSKGYKKPADLQGVKFFCGTSSPFFEPLFAEALGWDKMEVIPGLGGSERAMGVRRGELLATIAGTGQVKQNSDFMQPLVLTVKDPNFPDAPAISDVVLKGKEKWAKWIAAWDEVIYWACTTPGVPADRAAFLEQALEKTYNEPGFKADMQKLGFELADHFISGKELKEMANVLAALTDEEIAEMKQVIQQKYIKR